MKTLVATLPSKEISVQADEDDDDEDPEETDDEERNVFHSQPAGKRGRKRLSKYNPADRIISETDILPVTTVAGMRILPMPRPESKFKVGIYDVYNQCLLCSYAKDMHWDARQSGVEIKKSSVHGQGLFATSVLPPGSKIPVWGSFISNWFFKQSIKDQPGYRADRHVYLQYTDPECWLAISQDCAAYFCNCADKDHPKNCEFWEAPARQERPRPTRLSSNYLCIVTTRTVAIGEELFVPYYRG